MGSACTLPNNCISWMRCLFLQTSISQGTYITLFTKFYFSGVMHVLQTHPTEPKHVPATGARTRKACNAGRTPEKAEKQLRSSGTHTTMDNFTPFRFNRIVPQRSRAPLQTMLGIGTTGYNVKIVSSMSHLQFSKYRCSQTRHPWYDG